MSQYAAYEAAKRNWIATHPSASSSEYEAAMRAIASRYGV